jgi:hypothetical protein
MANPAGESKEEVLKLDFDRRAKAALARFCALLRALPTDEARPLWQSVAAEATIHVS